MGTTSSLNAPATPRQGSPRAEIKRPVRLARRFPHFAQDLSPARRQEPQHAQARAARSCPRVFSCGSPIDRVTTDNNS